MSQPEWMSKFNEIGQKGEEEVTEMGDSGHIRKNTEAPRRAPKFQMFSQASH